MVDGSEFSWLTGMFDCQADQLPARWESTITAHSGSGKSPAQIIWSTRARLGIPRFRQALRSLGRLPEDGGALASPESFVVPE